MAGSSGEPTRARDTVSEKIDHLFRTVRRDDGREYTYEDVERGTDGRVSRSYVWKLRHGRNRNPSLDVIEAFAQFFSVPPSYFFGDGLVSNADARRAALLAGMLKDPSSAHLAEKGRGLSPASVAVVTELIEHLRAIEDEGR
ncbi:MAG: helix-turn-helix domain-containing protein [Anaerolineae bacterium]|jgi:transcriptional regulator with XRE-family HTH domain